MPSQKKKPPLSRSTRANNTPPATGVHDLFYNQNSFRNQSLRSSLSDLDPQNSAALAKFIRGKEQQLNFARQDLSKHISSTITAAVRKRDVYIPLMKAVGKGPTQTLVALVAGIKPSIADTLRGSGVIRHAAVLACVKYLSQSQTISKAAVRRNLAILRKAGLICFIGDGYKAAGQFHKTRRVVIQWGQIEGIAGKPLLGGTDRTAQRLAQRVDEIQKITAIWPKPKGGRPKLNGSVAKVFRRLRGADGEIISFYEIANELKLKPNTVRKAVRQLIKGGFVERIHGGSGRSNASAYRTLKHKPVSIEQKVKSLRTWLAEFCDSGPKINACKRGTTPQAPYKRHNIYYINGVRDQIDVPQKTECCPQPVWGKLKRPPPRAAYDPPDLPYANYLTGIHLLGEAL